MKTAGLLALALLFPAFACATELININTADKATLMELEGIGETLANRIIEYRETNGPFSTIEELIHPNIERLYQSTFDKIKDNITVGDSAPADSPPSSPEPEVPDAPSEEATSTPTAVAPSSGGGTAEYLPIPALRIITSGDRTVSSGADVAFTVVVYDGKGNKRDDAVVTWSFGDGMRRTGASVFHRYYDSGDYIAIVHAVTSDGGDARSEILITVKHAGITIASVSSRGITLANSDSRTLDLSFWRLFMGGQEFRIPEDTYILAGRTILFPSQIIELPLAGSASLLYPSGEVAAAYPAIAPAPAGGAPLGRQPSLPAARLNGVQTVESVLNTSISGTAYENTAVRAPAAATELAAAGAAFSPPPEPASRVSALFKSPWTLSFIGLMALAGGAFIFL